MTTLDVLAKSRLSLNDLSTIDDLVRENALMQIIEIGKVASKFFRPDILTAEVHLHDSLMKLSNRATEMMDKQKQLAVEIASASEEKRAKITQEAMTRQHEIITRFQDEIRKLEQDHKQEIGQMTSMLQQIQQKIVGVGIGDIRQTTVIRDLKSACPMDDFSDENARKGGTDIVATVMEHGNSLGKVVISVKEVEKWSDFIPQIKKNMKEEQTDWAILVTKSFPSCALNEKMYVDTNGVLLVKTEYAPAAYMAIRHAVIYRHRAQSWLEDHEQSAGLHQQIMDVLKNWVNGEELRKILVSIDEADSATTQADDLLQKLQAHNEKQLKSTRELADKVRKSLQNCIMMLNGLKEALPLGG